MSRSKAPRMPGGLKAGSDMYWQSASYNSSLFVMFRQQIMTLALSRFEWVNLPPTCNERYLEFTLLTQGAATISFPKAQPGTFYSTQVAQQGQPNVYDNPSSWVSIGNNGWRFEAGPNSGVFVWDSMLRMPLLPWIDLWARELADIMRTAQINRMHTKTPYLLTGPQEKKFDLLQLFKQIAGGEPAVIGTDGLKTVDVEAISTGVPYLGEELNQALQNAWGNVYAMLGIPVPTFKQERQVQDEVLDHERPASLMALGCLEARRAACATLNERFSKYLPDGPVDCVLRNDLASANYETLHTLTKLNDLENGGDSDDDTGLTAL